MTKIFTNCPLDILVIHFILLGAPFVVGGGAPRGGGWGAPLGGVPWLTDTGFQLKMHRGWRRGEGSICLMFQHPSSLNFYRKKFFGELFGPNDSLETHLALYLVQL